MLARERTTGKKERKKEKRKKEASQVQGVPPTVSDHVAFERQAMVGVPE